MNRLKRLNSLLAIVEKRLPGESEITRQNRVVAARVYILLADSAVLNESKEV